MSDSEPKPDSANDATDDTRAEKSVKKGMIIVVAIILISLAWYLAADRFTPYTQQARVQGYVIGVAPKVAGLVTKVWVKNNEKVEVDQPLFEIDRNSYEITLKRAESDLQNAQSQVDASTAGIESARAQLRAAIAGETRARQDAERLERLYKQDPGAISVRRLEQSVASYKQAQAKVGVAEAEVQRAIDSKGGSDDNNAKLKAALSAVEKAKLDLDNTVVRASTRGIITDLRAEVGQYAGTGSPVLTLIAIDDVWVSAEFTENNLGHMKAGGPVEIVLDALPGRVFSGTIRSIGIGVNAGQVPPAGSLPTIENNRDWLRQSQRFPVIISLNPADRETLLKQVRVGGQAEVIAYTEGHGLLNFLGRLYIRFMSWFSYAY